MTGLAGGAPVPAGRPCCAASTDSCIGGPSTKRGAGMTQEERMVRDRGFFEEAMRPAAAWNGTSRGRRTAGARSEHAEGVGPAHAQQRVSPARMPPPRVRGYPRDPRHRPKKASLSITAAHPKPLWYAENRERFAPWSGAHRPHRRRQPSPGRASVPYLQARSTVDHRARAARPDAWAAIEDQARDSDVILLGDVDEFPPAEALEGTFPVATLSQRLAMYAVDRLRPRLPSLLGDRLGPVHAREGAIGREGRAVRLLRSAG